MSTKLASKLPKHTTENGLEAHEATFLAEPFEQAVIIAYVSTQKITIDYDQGGREPTVMVDAVEVITDEGTLATVRAAFQEAHDRRVNTAPTLPIEADEVVFPACGDCGHDREAHGITGVCDGSDERGDACECNEYQVLCTCGHAWGVHEDDDEQCTQQEMDSPVGCGCVAFDPKLAEADVDAAVQGLRDLGVTLTVVPGGASA